MCLLRLRFQIVQLHSTLRLSTVGYFANEQASTVKQILFRWVMTPALLLLGQAFIRRMWDFSECHFDFLLKV